MRLLPDGTAEVEVAASDMGPGTYTSMTQVAAETLGLPMEQVRFSLGRSDFPAAPPHGGSMTMASVGSAIRAACIAVQEEAAKRAVADQRSPVFGAPLDGVEWNEGRLRRRGDASPGQPYRDIVASAGQPIEAIASIAARSRRGAPLFDARLRRRLRRGRDRSRCRHDPGAPRASAPMAPAASSIRASPRASAPAA